MHRSVARVGLCGVGLVGSILAFVTPGSTQQTPPPTLRVTPPVIRLTSLTVEPYGVR